MVGSGLTYQIKKASTSTCFRSSTYGEMEWLTCDNGSERAGVLSCALDAACYLAVSVCITCSLSHHTTSKKGLEM